MIKFKSKKQHDKQGVWSSELNLRDCDAKRRKKVEKLLKKLEKEGFDETLSRP